MTGQMPVQTATKQVAEVDTSKRVLTMEEVQKHCDWGDCWTVIRGKVYDISEWANNHPGGTVIRLAFARDATALVESYHHVPSIAKVEALLGTKVKCVGILNAAPESEKKKEFFTDLRKRVDKHLKDIQIGYHHIEAVSIFEVVVTAMLFWVCTYFKVMHGSMLAAMFLGVFTGRLGFLMHMGNHCAISKNHYINRFTGLMMDMIGSTHYIWQFEHQVAHHCDPNEFGKDNDCEIGAPILRFHPMIKRAWYHKYNHLTTTVGMAGGLAKWTISDFFNLYAGVVSNVRLYVTKKEKLLVLFFKAQLFFFHLILPAYYWGLPWTMALFSAQLVIGGMYLENIFIVNHIQDGLVPPEGLHWAAKQVFSTANWGSASHFWNFVSGGLNHQIEHHLFPSMSHYLYPTIAPVVKQCCKDHGVPYKNYDSFPSAWMSMFTYLRDLGTPKFDNFQVPKLAA